MKAQSGKTPSAITRLHALEDFYFFDGHLIYASEDFIGWNPTISKALTQDRPERGTKVKVDEFEMRGSEFTVVLTSYIDWGPLRGYKGIEILKNGMTKIRRKSGSMGFGSNFFEGKEVLVEHGNAYLIKGWNPVGDPEEDARPQDLRRSRHYLLWFTDVVVPKKEEVLSVNLDSLPKKRFYTIGDIKHLRQVEWRGKITLDNCEIVVSRSVIPGFSGSKWDRGRDGYVEFKKDDFLGGVEETSITIEGIEQLSGQQD
jgi:hypothetical protein